jgi:protein SCO1
MSRARASVWLFLLAACAASTREYPLKGQVLGIDQQRSEILVRHEEIPGWMEAMTMPFTVRDRRLIAHLAVGDLITARLVVSDTDAYLRDITKIGTAPVVGLSPPPNAAAPIDLIEPGDPVPDQAFVDQDGRDRALASWHGTTVVMTFIYTRCPMPDFCPRMDRSFADIQREVKSRASLQGRVHLISVSFDPEFDTPAVLKQHAASAGADPSIWTFVTADREAVERFAGRFGVVITRGDAPDGSTLTHSLSTALIDRSGKLVKRYPGNDWTPSQLVADIETLQ